MCKVLKVSRSGYYEWLKRVPSNRDVENQLLMERIRKIYNKSKRTYGSPRITVDLKMQNVILINLCVLIDGVSISHLFFVVMILFF